MRLCLWWVHLYKSVFFKLLLCIICSEWGVSFAQPVFLLQLIGISLSCQSNQEVNYRKTTDQKIQKVTGRTEMAVAVSTNEFKIIWFLRLAELIPFHSKEINRLFSFLFVRFIRLNLWPHISGDMLNNMLCFNPTNCLLKRAQDTAFYHIFISIQNKWTA